MTKEKPEPDTWIHLKHTVTQSSQMKSKWIFLYYDCFLPYFQVVMFCVVLWGMLLIHHYLFYYFANFIAITMYYIMMRWWWLCFLYFLWWSSWYDTYLCCFFTFSLNITCQYAIHYYDLTVMMWWWAFLSCWRWWFGLLWFCWLDLTKKNVVSYVLVLFCVCTAEEEEKIYMSTYIKVDVPLEGKKHTKANQPRKVPKSGRALYTHYCLSTTLSSKMGFSIVFS